MAPYGKGKGGFDKALEKGTDAELDDSDWDAIVAICDFVRSGEIKPKYAVDSIMKRIAQDNQRVSKHALQILESLMKNCGPKMHQEVATKAFMDFMKAQAKGKTDSVKMKILELIQCWAHAFRTNSEFKVVGECFSQLKSEGFSFPELKEADAMFAAEVPPDWKDGEACFNCRADFGVITRKHHCRACGQILCDKCSSKRSAISKFGIDAEVRVCDACFNKLNPSVSGTSSESDLPADYKSSALAKQPQLPASKCKEAELEEEEQLQLALAISQSEAEAKEQEKRKRQNFMSLNATPPQGVPAGATVQLAAPPAIDFEEDAMAPELLKYLNRNYWEKKQTQVSEHSKMETSPAPVTKAATVVVTTTPSAPPAAQTDPSYVTSSIATSENYQNGVVEVNDEEREQFLKALGSTTDTFVNRMKSNSMRGRSIVNDSAVLTLFATLQNMHPQLMTYAKQQEDQRSYYEGLQDKLTQLRDARDALEALRTEHEEKRRLEAEERERRRQMAMAQKLEILRKKKQESLELQRQIALQKMQQQEDEMRMRLEQQKQAAQTRQMQLYGFPQDLQRGYAQYGQMIPNANDQAYYQQNLLYALAQGVVPPAGPQHLSIATSASAPGYDVNQPALQDGSGVAAPANSVTYGSQQGYPNNPGYAVAQMATDHQRRILGHSQIQVSQLPGYQPYNMQAVGDALPQYSAQYGNPGQSLYAPVTYSQQPMADANQPPHIQAASAQQQGPPTVAMQQPQYQMQAPQYVGQAPAYPPQQGYQQQMPLQQQQQNPTSYEQLISFD